MKSWVMKNQITNDSDFRNRVYEEAELWFNSLLYANMAYTVIKERGSFIGNGWNRSNFFGSSYQGLNVEMDRYHVCSMGNIRLMDVFFSGARFEDCGFSGGNWERVDAEKCRFKNCSFRNVAVHGANLAYVRFEDCVFQDVLLENVNFHKTVFVSCTLENTKVMEGQGCQFKKCIYHISL